MQQHDMTHLTYEVGGLRGGKFYGGLVRDINNECGSSNRAFA